MSGASTDTGESPVEIDDATATFRELREYAAGDLDVGHQDVHPIAGLIPDERARSALMFLAENYDPPEKWVRKGLLPRNFWETDFARRAVTQWGTHVATEAVANGNLTQASYVTGLPSYRSDVSGLHAINQLVDWLVHSEQCKLIYMAALMGRGKTDLSLTFLEVIDDHFERLRRSLKQMGMDSAAGEVPRPDFAANFAAEAPGDTEIREIHDFPTLQEWAERGSSDEVRWFIFDEASTELTAQSGANAQKVAERMAPFVKKMRKMGVDLIVIGHDKGDVHPAVRSLADFVGKTGTKTASFYAGINDREPQGHLFDLAGIPPTSWDYDTDDTADWSWDRSGDLDDVEDVDDDSMTRDEFERAIKERAGRLYALTPDDVTLENVASAVSTEDFSISRTTVSRYAKRTEPSVNQAAATTGD